jgi:hypothetical protein
LVYHSQLQYIYLEGFKMMDSYNAVGIAEGFIEAESEEQVIEAWQYLHDTRIGYGLQGWFGRTLNQLLDEGVITQ